MPKRDGCQKCGHKIDFDELEMLTVYPGITHYICPACGHEGTVHSGTVGYFDTWEEAVDADRELDEKAKEAAEVVWANVRGVFRQITKGELREYVKKGKEE